MTSTLLAAMLLVPANPPAPVMIPAPIAPPVMTIPAQTPAATPVVDCNPASCAIGCLTGPEMVCNLEHYMKKVPRTEYRCECRPVCYVQRSIFDLIRHCDKPMCGPVYNKGVLFKRIVMDEVCAVKCVPVPAGSPNCEACAAPHGLLGIIK